MINEEERTLKTILEDYKKEKENSRHNNGYTQANLERAIGCLKEKNDKNASFKELEQAYKDAGLYNE